MVYIAGIVAIYLCKYYCHKKLVEHNRDYARMLCIVFSFSVLFVISALRGIDVGLDTRNYANKFHLIQGYTWVDITSSFYTERVEFGYALLNKIVGVFSDDARSIMIVNSCIICYGMAYYVYHFTDSDCTAIMLFLCTGLYLYSFNLTRQMIAVVLLMNAWGLLNKKKYCWSLVLFIISLSMHITSFVFAVAYLFYFIRDYKWIVIIAFLSSLLVIVNYRSILSFASTITAAFNSYLDNSHNKISARGIWALWSVEILIAIIFAVAYFKSEHQFVKLLWKNCSLDSGNMICVPIFVMYYIIFSYLGTQFNYLNRIGVFFQPFTIVMFLNFEKLIESKSDRMGNIYRVGLHVCFIVYFLLSIQSKQYQYTFLS